MSKTGYHEYKDWFESYRAEVTDAVKSAGEFSDYEVCGLARKIMCSPEAIDAALLSDGGMVKLEFNNMFTSGMSTYLSHWLIGEAYFRYKTMYSDWLKWCANYPETFSRRPERDFYNSKEGAFLVAVCNACHEESKHRQLNDGLGSIYNNRASVMNDILVHLATRGKLIDERLSGDCEPCKAIGEVVTKFLSDESLK